VFESKVGHSSPGKSVGEAVNVRYDPDNPEKACEDSFVAFWGFTAGLTFLAVLTVSSGLILLK